MGGMLSTKTHDLNQELPLTAAVAADLTDISFKAGFQSLSLDTVIEITGLPLETNEEAMKMMIECKKHIWKDKNLSQALQDYFTITTNLLLWRTKKEEQNDNGIMKIALEGFIRKSHSLGQQLRAHYNKIGPKKRKYRILQFVASIFAMMPQIIHPHLPRSSFVPHLQTNIIKPPHFKPSQQVVLNKTRGPFDHHMFPRH